MHPGKTVDKNYWFCIDHRDGTMWVYSVGGSVWMVGVAEEHIV